MNIKAVIVNFFKADHIRYQGVAPINIYAMRLFFALMFVFVGMDSWVSFTHSVCCQS